MKNVSIFILFLLVLPNQDDSLKYLGQQPPGMTPEVFAPGIVSKPDAYEYGSVFSKDGTEFYYGVDLGNRAEIRYMVLKNKKWTAPKAIISNTVYSYNDPFLSPDEQELYFISNHPKSGADPKKDYDIWYVKKQKGKWSLPINAGTEINSDSNEYYMSFSKNNTMYFSSNKSDKNNFDIYTSDRVNGKYQKAKSLSTAINTRAYEADVFVAPDESYVIFCSVRQAGLGRGDLYISFKQEDGSWTAAKNMGNKINSSGHELCPFVSADGKYLFYTSRKDIYWVDAKIIELYK